MRVKNKGIAFAFCVLLGFAPCWIAAVMAKPNEKIQDAGTPKVHRVADRCDLANVGNAYLSLKIFHPDEIGMLSYQSPAFCVTLMGSCNFRRA
jgi:hypothetical protein